MFSEQCLSPEEFHAYLGGEVSDFSQRAQIEGHCAVCGWCDWQRQAAVYFRVYLGLPIVTCSAPLLECPPHSVLLDWCKPYDIRHLTQAERDAVGIHSVTCVICREEILSILDTIS